MKHSRVAKFKEYRDSFTKVNAEDLDGANDIISGLSKDGDFSSTTNTLPIDEVIHEVVLREDQEKELKRIKNIRLFKIIGYSLLGVILIVLTIIIGFIAFGGK